MWSIQDAKCQWANYSSACLEVPGLHFGSILGRFLYKSDLKWLQIFHNGDDVYWKINFCLSRQTFDAWTIAERLKVIDT